MVLESNAQDCLSKTVMCGWLKYWRQGPHMKNVVFLLVHKRFIYMLLSYVHLYLLFHIPLLSSDGSTMQMHSRDILLSSKFMSMGCCINVSETTIQHFHDYVHWLLSCWLQSKSSSVLLFNECSTIGPSYKFRHLLSFTHPKPNQMLDLVKFEEHPRDHANWNRVDKGDSVESVYIEAQDGAIS